MQFRYNNKLRIILCILAASGLSSGYDTVRSRTCSFEPPGGSCSWTLPPPVNNGYSGIRAASDSATDIGPTRDVNPGTTTGHFAFYYSNSTIASTETVLFLSSYQYVCGLSFSIYVSGPLNLEVIRFNADSDSVYNFMDSTFNASVWSKASYNYTSADSTLGGNLMMFFRLSSAELGEAELLGMPDVFLALDNVTLTFCLPCDYDGLVESGAIIVGGPQEIAVMLRQSVTFQFNATAPACPNETLAFVLESVEPPSLLPIFSIDRATGFLVVDGSGSSLEASGVSNGYINVSVHVVNSNYSQEGDVHRESVLIPFSQPPTISLTSPPSTTIDVTAPFSYRISAASQLGQNLNIGSLATSPDELAQDVNITVISHQGHNLVLQVSGQISLDQTVPAIALNSSVVPFISVPIQDAVGGVVLASTQLLLNPSPPLFEFLHYEFSLAENAFRGSMLGPIRTLDPDGQASTTPPVIVDNSAGDHQTFTVIESLDAPSPPYTTYFILSTIEFDYELVQHRNFEIVAVDSRDASLNSSATVRVNILPVNEFPPVFVVNSIEVTIQDNFVRRAFVASVIARDRDGGADGMIDYNITSGNEDGYFITSGTGFGEIVVRKSPINPHTYHLIITASDRGNPQMSTIASVIVNVIATVAVNCTEITFGPPLLSSPLPLLLQAVVTSNLTISCSYKANPEARGFRWERNKQALIVGQRDSHYLITNVSLTIDSVNSTDGGFYYYNVTNQCGPSILAFYVSVIDYPNTPSDVQVVGQPHEETVTLSWDVPSKATEPVLGKLSQPVDGYVVQARDLSLGDGDLEFVNYTSLLSVGTTTARVTGLHPGKQYEVRVLVVNVAGSTPSRSVFITTNASVPQIAYFRTSAFPNNSILLEWQLEYDGGLSIVDFQINVTLHNVRPTAIVPAQPNLVYHKSTGTDSLVTVAVPSGYSYAATAVARNALGSSQQMSRNVFVGSTDFSLCDFETGGSEAECPWQVSPHTVIRASAPPSSSFPSTDATTGSSQGYYLAGLITPGTERIMATLPRAGYACSLSFSYYISDRTGARLDLRSSSGQLIWSSTADRGAGMGWIETNLPGSSQYFTSDIGNSIQFVAATIGANASVAVDDIAIRFCLPCAFDQLQGSSAISLVYSNNSRVFLRTPHVMPLLVGVSGCPNAALNYSIVRVIPGDIVSSFSLDSSDGRNLSLRIGAISPSLVEPNSIGYLEVSVSVLNTDYKPTSRFVGTTATIEFLLVQAAENCTFRTDCLYDEEKEACSHWAWGEEASIVNSPRPNIIQNTGSYLYSSSSNPEVTLAASVVNESFCQFSFSYLVAPTAELSVRIRGLGEVWSSVEAPGSGGPTWLEQSVRVDLRDAEVLPNRTVYFLVRLNAGATSMYAGLDNLTLHPCIDCDTPVCTLTSCMRGHYYSLDYKSCLACPRGYYCPDWRISPKPCPVGTYGTNLDSLSISTCLACPPDTFSIQAGSIECLSCPTGFNCSNSSSLPVHLGEDTCPTSSGSSDLVPVAAFLGAALGVSCLICSCLCLLLVASWCSSKKTGRRDPRKGKQSSSDGFSEGLSAHKSGKHLKGKNYGKSSVRTMMSFLSFGSDTSYYNEEQPWSNTENMTSSMKSAQSDTGFSMTFSNNNCDDDSDDERELIELRNR